MDKKDIEILEKNGWIVQCESPFEIYNYESNSSASGEAANIVLWSLKPESEEVLLRAYTKWLRGWDFLSDKKTPTLGLVGTYIKSRDIHFLEEDDE